MQYYKKELPKKLSLSLSLQLRSLFILDALVNYSSLRGLVAVLSETSQLGMSAARTSDETNSFSEIRRSNLVCFLLCLLLFLLTS